MFPRQWTPILAAMLLAGASRAEGDPAPHLARIKAVGPEGKGNADAAKAWKELVGLGTPALIPAIAAMKDANPIAVNWLRSAVNAIADKKPLPAKELEAFVLDRMNGGEGRRLAYEILVTADATTPKRLLPDMLDDPSAGLRRDAVAVVIGEADASLKNGDAAAAEKAFRKALTSARDNDQVDHIAKQLKTMKIDVDFVKHFGLIPHWKLITPFDNVGMKGYPVVYPPEMEIDLKKSYIGKEAAQAKWVDHVTKDPRGVVDLNKALGNLKGTIAYAYTEIDSAKEQQIQIRAGCITALKIYLNGKLVFAREEYHHGQSMDQHVGFGTLKPGKNTILIKVCQNEQKEMWAQNWQFSLRLCDELGGAVPFKVTLAKDDNTKTN